MYDNDFPGYEAARMDIAYDAREELLTLTMSEEIVELAEDMFTPLLGPAGFTAGERTVENVVTCTGDYIPDCVVVRVHLARDKGLAIEPTIRRYLIEHSSE